MYDYRLANLEHVQEVKRGYITIDEAQKLICEDKGLSFIDCGKYSLLLGQTEEKSALIKVCTNLGISCAINFNDELHKIKSLNELTYKPDIIFDHTPKSIIEKPFWRFMIKHFDGVVATAPVIVCFDQDKGIDKNLFFECIEEMAVEGVRLMLFHPTATRELWEKSVNTRIRPTTSWNGALLQRDIMINNRKESFITENFDEILKILHKYNVTCDIGTVFRPARISEALDEVHREELILQELYIKKAKNAGVFTIREGVGHISLDKIFEFCSILDKSTPIMPLPVSTDAAIGFDHIACATATTIIGYFTNLGVINPVTRVEHAGGIPNLENIIESLKTAKTIAHSLDLRNIPAVKLIDDLISDSRQNLRSCIVNGGLFGIHQVSNRINGCERCNIQCPFIYN